MADGKRLRFLVNPDGSKKDLAPGTFTFYTHTGAGDLKKKGQEIRANPGHECAVEECLEAEVHLARGQAVLVAEGPRKA